MSGGKVLLERAGPVARVTFDRPEARNALTWDMYEQLDRICAELAADGDLRAVVFRGAGGKAFVAGTDISLFRDFRGGEDGIAYERRMDRYLERIRSIPVPTVAVIEGWAVGGGLSIATACDLRIATSDASFGVPIARTIGNCLSMRNYARLVAGFGEGRAKRMLMLGDMLDAEEALAAGYLARVVDRAGLDGAVAEALERIQANAPLTLRISKEAIRRITSPLVDDGADLIGRVYASEDFRAGVAAFSGKKRPDWEGR